MVLKGGAAAQLVFETVRKSLVNRELEVVSGRSLGEGERERKSERAHGGKCQALW